MKVLIVKVGAMGDLLHALPAVAALRAARPDWTIDWVVDTRWAPLLVDSGGAGPIVNRAHLADTRRWSNAPFSFGTVRSLFALRRALRAGKYDLVVDMQGTMRSAVIGRMAGAPVFAGYGDPRERLAVALYSKKFARRGTHVVGMGFALLIDATGVPLAEHVGPGFELPREADADQWAASETDARPLCVLTPGAGWGAKRWPASKFGELAQELHARGFDVVLNATREGDTLADNVVAASRGTARLMTCDLAGLIALLRRARLLVGGDSGPTHLAATLGVALVALFGPTDPRRNGPWGPGGCRVLRDPTSVTSYKRVGAPDPGLERLSVEAVLAAALEIAPAAGATANSSSDAP